jgi:hypothetical protein
MTEHRPRYAFDHHIFESSTFDCHKFINTVAHANGLEQVRTDLQDHLTTVQNNLLSLVHRDYADFVQLSSELEGVDVTLQECQRPIVDLHRATKQLKDAAEFSLDTIRSGLRRHDELAQEHTDMSEMLCALQMLALGEQLLSRARGGTTEESEEDDDQMGSEEAIVEECAVLERVARLLAHLQVLQSQIQSNNDGTNKDRQDIVTILRVRSTSIQHQLLRRLEVSYGTEVVPDSTSGDLIVNRDAMLYCLRAYSSGTDEVVMEASVVFAKLVMGPFLNEFVTQGRLDGKGKRGSCEGLSNILECITNYIKNSCRAVLDVVREMNSTAAADGRQTFSMIEDGVWAPIAAQLKERLGHQVSGGQGEGEGVSWSCLFSSLSVFVHALTFFFICVFALLPSCFRCQTWICFIKITKPCIGLYMSNCPKQRGAPRLKKSS